MLKKEVGMNRMQTEMQNIVVVNQENLEKIKKQISEQGDEKFHVIADFDRTLTKAFVNGKKIPSIVSILRDKNYLSKDYPEKAKALFEKYHPIEINSNISIKDKKQKMHEWWKSHFNLLIRSGLTKNDLLQIVKDKDIQLRKGADEFLNFLNKKNIPLIILSSSGIGEVIEMFLKKHGKMHDNLYIISNFFNWENGKAVSVKEPIIHVMNKSEIAVKKYPIFDKIKQRKNVLLIGDSLGDLGMIDGFDYNNLIKIGFLNVKIDENLNIYKKNFDVILLNDASMDYVNKLLKEVLG